jgi:aldose sugar dehydrogenase
MKTNYLIKLSLIALTLGSYLITSCEKNEAEPSPALPSTGGTTNPNSGEATRTVINSLNVPWEILWGPDNFIWTTERNGRISRINPDNGQQTTIANLTNVTQVSEGGLLGMILHPNFTTQPYIYVVYTYTGNGSTAARVSRFTYSNNTLIQETTLLENIPATATHFGGRLVIQNNHLFVTTGDNGNSSLPQNLNSLAGKVLRMNLDGSIPTDNPFPNSYVWSYGHRNPQGLLVHSNGNMYSSEHGANTDDEFNIIRRGRNYGWPNVLGVVDNPTEVTFSATNPNEPSLANWTPNIAPSGIALYSNDRVPQFQNKILMAVLRDQMVVALTLSQDGQTVVNREEFFRSRFGRIRDICVSPEGRVFIATGGNSFSSSSGHSIIEINRVE